MSIDDDRASDASYVELVSALFRTLPPTLIMTALFCGTGFLAFQRTHDLLIVALLGAGTLASLARIAVVMHGRGVVSWSMGVQEAVAVERRFAIPYLLFALILGLFALRLAVVNHDVMPIIAAVLVSGYAAGVSAGVYVRPWICVPAIVLSVAPLIVYLGSSEIDVRRFVALLLFAFAAGGIESAMSRFKSERGRIIQSLKLASFTRQDDLTSLPNQLALLEEIEGSLTRRELGWLHIIEVDGLAMVNRSFGHAMGDDFLKTVAARLGATVGGNGFLARLGGGQFGVFQVQVHSTAEIAHLIDRLAQGLHEPYAVDGFTFPMEALIASVQSTSGNSATDFLTAARLAERKPLVADGAKAA